MSVRKLKLVIPADLVANMLAHVQAQYPLEAVGILSGHSTAGAVAFYPLRNIAGAGQFLADPFEQWKALCAMRARGERLIAVCHSHPDGGPTLSKDDLASATDGAFQVVVATTGNRGGPTQLSAYRIVRQEAVAVPIEIL